MIVGGHVMIQSRNDAADKAFFRKVLKLSHVDAGGGFLLFALPPSEIAIHESGANDVHQLYLMCEDMDDFVDAMDKAEVEYTTPVNHGWGTVSSLTLPGGGKLAVYQAHHVRPQAKAAAKKAKAATKKTKKAAPKRKAARKKKKARRR